MVFIIFFVTPHREANCKSQPTEACMEIPTHRFSPEPTLWLSAYCHKLSLIEAKTPSRQTPLPV